MTLTRMNTTGALPRIALLGLILGLLASAVFAGGGPNVGGAKLYIQQNDLDKAASVLLKEVTKVNPKNEDAWYLLGYVYARQKNYEEMTKAFDKALELKPKFMEKGVKVGKDSGRKFHSKHGVAEIKRLVWASSFNTGVKQFNDAINATDDSLRAQNFDKAIASFKAASMIQPDSTLAYRNWAAALQNAGRAAEAVEPLKKALEAQPNNAEVMTMLAQVYINTDNTMEAVPVLEALWAQNVRTEEVADYLSRCYVREGKIDEAKGIYKEALAENPDNFQFRYNYGTILLEAQDYGSAIEQLAKAYEIDSSSSDINYNLGAAYLNRGVNAREALPEDSEDKEYLTDFESAFPYLERSVKMNPEEESIWFTLGRIAGQLNKISLAGYAFSKGEPTKSALDEKVIVGMPSETLKAILGDPDEIKPVESQEFSTVEEWAYRTRKPARGKVAIPEPLNVYVNEGRVDALMVIK